MKTVRDRTLRSQARASAVVALAGLVLALSTACGAGSGETVTVTHPPTGAEIALPFEVTIDASMDLGSPADGLHHLHIWFGDDESSYLVVESATVEIVSAPIGEHEMHVSLRHADHSDAGAETSVPLTISAGPAG